MVLFVHFEGVFLVVVHGGLSRSSVVWAVGLLRCPNQLTSVTFMPQAAYTFSVMT